MEGDKVLTTSCEPVTHLIVNSEGYSQNEANQSAPWVNAHDHDICEEFSATGCICGQVRVADSCARDSQLSLS